MGDEALRFESVTVDFRPRRGSNAAPMRALERTTFSVQRGEFVSVVGPSGCGKSTLLNLAAGLMTTTAGTVLYSGEPVKATNTKVGYITQQDNLLPWQTVSKNIELALRIRHVPKQRRNDIVRNWIDLVGLNGFDKHYPRELSGGMRKRVAIARTLCYDPDSVLLDEPFGALDAQLRVLMQEELLRVWSTTSKTMLFITHDLAEAVALSDRVVVLSAKPGRVVMEQQIDLPRPRDIRKLRFSPEFNELHGLLWSAIESNLAGSGNE